MSIIFENVTKSFGKKILFENLNLKFESGKTTLIKGASGTGKTTLLRMIAGLDTPSRGKIKTDGGKIAYAFQDYRLLPHSTVRGNIAAICENYPDDIAAACLISDIADKYPATLSGGECARVSLCRALAANADIILLDEPFGALDEMTREKISQNIRRYLIGKTVLLVSHTKEDENLADAIISI